MPGARNLLTRVVTVDDLPPATAAFIREQAAARGLERDPLPEVTHGLRTDEETLQRQRRGPSTVRHTWELLLTPELLIVSYREGGDDAAVVDPAAKVGFHRLDQLELAAPPAALAAEAPGARASAPKDALTLESTPLGGVRRAARHIPVGTSPEVTRFRAALLTAVQRRGAGT